MICEICKEFGEIFRDSRPNLRYSRRDFAFTRGNFVDTGRGGWEWNMGSVADIQQRAATCQNCQAISEFIRPEWGVVDTISLKSSDTSPDHFRLWHMRLPGSGTTIGSGSFIIHDEDVSVDSAWIDISIIQRWLNSCNQTHDHECLRPKSQNQDSALKTLYLVDVEQGCLVQLPSTTRYFALSYVWGQVAAITEAQMDNIDMLCERGNITLNSPLVQLPETIRDALRLLQQLGERYLWVDRLCIIQDDEKNKLLQVLNMDTIFMNAYCTIVAADGTDANWGLPGVGSGSRPHHLPQRTLNFGNCSAHNVPCIDWSDSHHTTRGWTFQETFLTRRYIAFSHNTVFWQCQRSEWQEVCLEKSTPWHRPGAKQMTLHMKSWPDLSEWGAAVQEYNKRNLTFPKDIHRAFAGIEKCLERSFPAGFIYGLPEFFFDLAMLWQTSAYFPSRGSSTRRGKEYRATSGYAVPSWSWLGWKDDMFDFGLFNLNRYCSATSFREGFELKLLSDGVQVEPLFDWYQVDPSTGNRRRIRNDHHDWRARAQTSASPPDGWTRNVSHNGLDSYMIASAPDIEFQYPIPTPAELPPEPAQLSWPPYLQFRSCRAKFRITGSVSSSNRREKDIIVGDALESRSGCLRLNISYSQATSIGQECELVAISRGRTDIKTTAGDWPTFSRSFSIDSEGDIVRGETYELYNVLWIKWEGEYAVREALGHIEKSAWERQELEEIDVQLR